MRKLPNPVFQVLNKNLFYLLFGFFIGFGLPGIAFFIEYPTRNFDKTIVFTIIAIVEEALKGGVSITLFNLGALAPIPVAVATGFGVNELIAFVLNGVAVSSRLNAMGFHIFTGVLLWTGIRGGKMWIAVMLIINILLHTFWNLNVTT